MFGDRVNSQRTRGIGRRRKNIWQSGNLDDVGSMASPGALRVIGVNSSAGDGCDGMVHEAGLVQRVGMNGNLHVISIRYAQARVDRGGYGWRTLRPTAP